MNESAKTDELVSGTDRTQVGLPIWAFEKLERLVRETPWFERQQDAFKLGISVALRRGWKPVDDKIETKWHVAGVDPDGSLKLLVESLAPECGDKPYDFAQRIAAPGINYLFEELVERRRTLGETLGLDDDASAADDAVRSAETPAD